MPHELIYTSAPSGLRPGSTGYCTVAQTPGLPTDLAEQLEALSHFRHLKVGDDPTHNGNPLAFAHSILTMGYRVHHVVSRVADSGVDHSGRSNFLAHHVVFGTDSLPEVGPAWLCEQRFFVVKWDRPSAQVPDDRAIPSGSVEPRLCQKWARLAGDAGWGGVLAAATNPAEPAYLVYEPGQDVIGLVAEAMALLPPDSRWNVTFNTYFTGAAVRTTCQWRCVPIGSPEAKEAMAVRRGLVLRIDQPMSGEPRGPLVEAARTGILSTPTPPRRAAPSAAPDFEPVSPPPRSKAIAPWRAEGRKPSGDGRVREESSFDVDSAESRPLPPSPGPSRGPVGPLLMGLVLGGLLVLAFSSAVELAVGKSLLGFAGVKGKAEEDARAELARVEGDGQSKATELDKEKKASERFGSESRGLRIQLQDKVKEFNALNDKVNVLTAENDLLKNRPAAPMAGAGVFVRANEGAKLQKRNKELETAKAAVKKLEKDIEGLKTKLAMAGNVPVAPSLPVLRLDKINLAGQPAHDLFRMKLGDNAKPTIELFGLPPDIVLTVLGAGDRVRLHSQDTGFDGTLEIAKDGQVRIVEGKNMDKHPFLGFALIRVNPGDGNPPLYRQLFGPSHAQSAGLTAELPKGVAPEGRMRKYAFKYDSRLGQLKPEADSLKAGKQFAGRNARIGIANRFYDLEVLADPSVIENRPLEGDPAIKLRVEGGEVILEVSFPDAKDIPDKCRIEALEIVHWIEPDKARNFPGYSQELLRLYPK